MFSYRLLLYSISYQRLIHVVRASSIYGAHWRFKNHEKSIRVSWGSSSRALSEPLGYDTRLCRPTLLAMFSEVK